MKRMIKSFIRNFGSDYSESENFFEVLSKQNKRYKTRLLNFVKKIIRDSYDISRTKIHHLLLNQQTWLYLQNKKVYRALLGKEGYQHVQKIIGSAQNKKEALFQVGMFFINAGLPDEANKCFEISLSMGPEDYIIHNYLQFLMFTSPENYSHQYIYNAHVKWGSTLVENPRYTSYPNPLTLKRRLKIAYTCHFITNSTSTTLLLPMLKAHNKDKIEVYMYSDQDPKQTTDEVRSLVENWRDTYGMSNDEFCEKIRRDQIDILLELNGHCTINRYRAITRKPAPIQINYYNYSCTTGVPGIDYTFGAEENYDIRDLQPYFSERIFIKKGVTAATSLSPHFPPISPSPFIQNGYITFGSFGQAHKVSRNMIKLWCEVLNRIPTSKFYMKASVLDYPANLSMFKQHFSDSGIDMSRIMLEGASDYATLLKLYSKVDIALDTYPYASGTTTIEAFIQGVPTISLVGERFCSRQGYGNLHPLGHDELLAYSKEEYIAKAVNLANDPQRLIKYRETFRDDYSHSSRADMETFINDLEDAYSQMWATYVEEQTYKSKAI